MNIVEPILYQCSLQPKAAAICAPGSGLGLISYGRLAQHIHNIGRVIHKLKLAPGMNVAVSVEDLIFQAAIILALTRLGIVTVSSYDERIVGAIKLDALITDKPLSAPKVGNVILTDLSWTRGDGSPLDPQAVPRTASEDLCRIILTSGSTGSPKAVAFSHRMVADRVALNNVVFGSTVPNCSRIYSDLPLSSVSGFRFLIHTLWRGGTFFMPGTKFENTIDAFEEYKVQCLLASPGGVEVLLKHYDRWPSLPSEFEVMVVLGDKFPKALSDRARTRICSNIMSIYGATETSTIASAPIQMIADTPGAVGFVAPGVTVEIVSESGLPLPPGSEGLVRTRSPHAVDRYMGDPDASAKSFRDGWFYPGDLGVLEAGNMLRIVGRRDALLNLGGDKVNPDQIESVVASCQGVAACASFGVPNELGVDAVWVAFVADARADEAKLRAHCKAHLPPQFVPAGFVRVDQMPRNDLGKIDRQRLRALVKP